jgi:DNA-directed RNA polymerase specialized sigma24 family protein
LTTGTVYVRLSEGRHRLRQMLLEPGEIAPGVKDRMG